MGIKGILLYFAMRSKANFSCQDMSSYGQCSKEKLAGGLLLGLRFVKPVILSTSFIDFLYDKLGELRYNVHVIIFRPRGILDPGHSVTLTLVFNVTLTFTPVT